jgi:hypothetical protein
MSEGTTVEADREVFRAAALEWARLVAYAWPRESADPAIEAMHALSTAWAERGAVRELLMPLLAKSNPLGVRVCAASHMYRNGCHDVAPLLREFAENDDVVTTPARALVHNHSL